MTDYFYPDQKQALMIVQLLLITINKYSCIYYFQVNTNSKVTTKNDCIIFPNIQGELQNVKKYEKNYLVH